MAKRVLIFFPHRLRQRHGGPYSMLYHLQQGLRGFSHNVQFLSSLINFTDESDTAPTKAYGLKRFVSLLLPKRWRNVRRVRKWLKEASSPDENIVKQLDVSGFEVLHFHESVDVWRYKKLLENFSGTVVLTSHSPKPYHLELLEDVFALAKNGLAKRRFRQLEAIDRFAYERADQLVFPCKEATESYFELWPAFAEITKPKKFSFVTTGVTPSFIKKKPLALRQTFGIPPEAFVVSFVGRKIAVKGFDLLKEAATRLLPQYNDLYFLVIGRKENALPFQHKRWIETGWTDDPFSFVAAGNLQVVPNRYTNFDLNVLEVLSLGRPLLLSNTGGNKYFKRFETKGIFYHEPNAEDLAEQIKSCYQQRNKLESLGAANKGLYEENFTALRFARDQLHFYESL
jgi:glycosyltransferase involved in cell wall biosynthesis